MTEQWSMEQVRDKTRTATGRPTYV